MNTDFSLVTIVVALAVYAFFAVCLSRIGTKAGFGEIAWWSWVPVMQILLILKVAGVAWWWIFLLMIPLVNLVIGMIVWIKVAQKLGKSPWVGVLMFVPAVDLFVLGYLAFSK